MLKGDIFDHWFRMYLLVGAIHYSFDTWVKFSQYGLVELLRDDCKLMYTIHHFFTLFVFKSLWMLDHYTWFVAGPPAYHCIMVCCPNFEGNNYIYGFFLVAFVFLQLSNKAIMRTNVHMGLLCVTPLLIYPIANMGRMNCNS